MYLYKKNKKYLNIYDFVPNNIELIELKKKYLKDIKSVILHVNNENTFKRLLTNSTIMFNTLDKKENNGKISYIEDTKNDEIISKYINGEFDSIDPVLVIGDPPVQKSNYSDELNNEDGSLLFGGGHFHNEYVTDEGILLTGFLGELQPLLSDDINNFVFSDIFGDLDEEVIDFLKIFNCTKQRIVSLDDLNFLYENSLFNYSDNFQDTIEKSEEVLNYYNKAKRKIKNNNNLSR